MKAHDGRNFQGGNLVRLEQIVFELTNSKSKMFSRLLKVTNCDSDNTEQN